ncbi:MAG: metalloregulator ArsR/SmtB family transcription factor [Clostridia bacterium]|nr:metalloregulator ArsR/SmtB family transcription factor [Clostridia bacterium]
MQSNTLYEDYKKTVKEYMPAQKVLSGIADFFYIFSDITRIKMIIALAVGEMCVNELVDSLDLNQSTISHQLKLLRDANIVSYKRCGKQLYYYISNRHVEDVMLSGTKSLE